MNRLSLVPTQSRKLRVVCVSDTHNHAPGEGYTLPKGDILIHAGDLTNQGSLSEIKKAALWLKDADFATKIVVAGNHDLSLDQNYSIKYAEGWSAMPEDMAECQRIVREIPGVTYLEHESVELDVDSRRLRIFGSPWSLEQRRQNWAFQYKYDRAEDIWSAISDDVDIVVTHTPPKGYVDASTHWPDGGCAALTKAVHRVKPMMVVCGHHHEGRGAVVIDWAEHEAERDVIATWHDPGHGNKKQSLLDLSKRPARSARGTTAVVNASIMKASWSASKQKAFNKAILVDLTVLS